MPSNNPFYFDQSAGRETVRQRGEMLSGVGNIIAENRQKQEAQAANQQAKTDIRAAMQSGDPSAMADVMIKYPEMQKTAEAAFGFANEQTKQAATKAYQDALSNPDRAIEALDKGAREVHQGGGMPSNLVQDLKKLQNAATPEEKARVMKDIEFGYSQVDPKGYKNWKEIYKEEGAGSEQRFFESLTEGLSEEEAERARRTKLGLSPRAVGSSIQTITDMGTAVAIADTERVIEGGKETGKLGAQLKIKPQIEREVTLARKAAEARGETLTDLDRAEAAMPGLLDTVGRLKDLSKIATSTIGGRIFDVGTKELGFGSTKGATARAKFIAIINNQVLPLLKPTFGGSFSVQEGESLKATMGDPDASPEEKIAQLESFIDQKVRDLQSKQRELDIEDPSTPQVDPALLEFMTPEQRKLFDVP